MASMYMYDVRGIQSYIFRTNKIKEIMGASHIVQDVILNTFYDSCKDIVKVKKYKDIKDKEVYFNFDSGNPKDYAEIMYYGGGNLFVFFENEEKAELVNKKMRIELAKKTYSLQLAVASEKIHGSNTYEEDMKNLRKKMNEVKLNMPAMLPVRSFPFTMNDPQTGMPFSRIGKDGLMITYESDKKLKAFRKIDEDDSEYRILNEFGTELGESMIAVVHIDGNNMGDYIKGKIGSIGTYTEATKVMRKISSDIDDVFTNIALENVRKKVPYFCEKRGVKKDFLPFRTIIHAGDDITFVCNARIALDCVKEYAESIEEANKQYSSNFSVCGGMFIMHSHFPFARAYELAEELCSNAKVCSRPIISDEEKGAANFIDFQVSYSGLLNDMDTIRERYFVDSEGNELLGRPYHIGKNSLSTLHGAQEIEALEKMLQTVSNLPRSKVKSLRESFYDGKEYVDMDLLRINSRISDEDKKIVCKEEKDYRILFDAIDIMDLKWGENHE
ncbi:MAG: hypothetical protein Q4C49_11755 [Bacillota bacterium]|nr:hypothetical protein [Bacillota bacterium]